MPDVFLNQSGESSKANKKNRHPESNDSGVPVEPVEKLQIQ